MSKLKLGEIKHLHRATEPESGGGRIHNGPVHSGNYSSRNVLIRLNPKAGREKQHYLLACTSDL